VFFYFFIFGGDFFLFLFFFGGGGFFRILHLKKVKDCEEENCEENDHVKTTFKIIVFSSAR
jgi:hypothetical protein